MSHWAKFAITLLIAVLFGTAIAAAQLGTFMLGPTFRGCPVCFSAVVVPVSMPKIDSPPANAARTRAPLADWLGGDKAPANAQTAGFLTCNEQLRKTANVIGDVVWSDGPLPTLVRGAIGKLLEGGQVLKWTERQNQKGTTIFVVQVRFPHDEMSDWLLLLEQGGAVSLKLFVYADAFAFSKDTSDGVSDLYFCAKGEVSHEWTWVGTNWK